MASALLSWRIATPDYLFIDNTPLLPALWFGLVLCGGTALWASRGQFAILVVLLATFVAWQAATEATSSLHDIIAQQIKPSALAGAAGPGLGVPDADYLWGLCGMAGGMIGSAIVAATIAAFVANFRTAARWASPILLGTIAGFLLECAEEPAPGGLFIHIGSLLPLFLVWQIGVAAVIAYNLDKALTINGAKPRRS